MSTSLDGQKCPVCHGYLFDDDEIVYCPICGAPHHKDCYAKLQHCALQNYHGTEMEYRKPGSEEQHSEPASSSHNHEEHNHSPETCPNCGFQLPEDAKFCPNCNRPVDLNFVAGLPFISIVSGEIDPYGGINKNEKTEGATAEQLKDYVLINTGRYIPKFFKLNKSSKLSWNWAAFLFPAGWLFYRKVYSIGIIALIATICSSLLTNMYYVILQQISDAVPVDYFNNSAQVATYFMNNISKFNLFPIYMFVAGVVLSFIIRVVFGLFGDWFYRTNAIEHIEQIKNDEEIEDLTMALRTKGGINPFLAAAAIFGVSTIVTILFQLF